MPEVVDPPREIVEGDRLLFRWVDGREETVTVDRADKTRDGYRLAVTADPPPDLPHFYYRELPRP